MKDISVAGYALRPCSGKSEPLDEAPTSATQALSSQARSTPSMTILIPVSAPRSITLAYDCRPYWS